MHALAFGNNEEPFLAEHSFFRIVFNKIRRRLFSDKNPTILFRS
jgi:hypothetical protein